MHTFEVKFRVSSAIDTFEADGVEASGDQYIFYYVGPASANQPSSLESILAAHSPSWASGQQRPNVAFITCQFRQSKNGKFFGAVCNRELRLSDPSKSDSVLAREAHAAGWTVAGKGAKYTRCPDHKGKTA